MRPGYPDKTEISEYTNFLINTIIQCDIVRQGGIVR